MSSVPERRPVSRVSPVSRKRKNARPAHVDRESNLCWILIPNRSPVSILESKGKVSRDPRRPRTAMVAQPDGSEAEVPARRCRDLRADRLGARLTPPWPGSAPAPEWRRAGVGGPTKPSLVTAEVPATGGDQLVSDRWSRRSGRVCKEGLLALMLRAASRHSIEQGQVVRPRGKPAREGSAGQLVGVDLGQLPAPCDRSGVAWHEIAVRVLPTGRGQPADRESKLNMSHWRQGAL